MAEYLTDIQVSHNLEYGSLALEQNCFLFEYYTNIPAFMCYF